MMSDGEAEGSAQGALGGGARGRCTVYGVGLAGGEIGEDSVDEVGGLDARDHAQRPATYRTVLDVDVETNRSTRTPYPLAAPAAGAGDRRR